MNELDLGTHIEVTWNDAKLFQPINRDIELSKMMTTGFLERKNDRYVLVRKPITINIRTRKKHPPEGEPTFYYIPTSMIEKIKITE